MNLLPKVFRLSLMVLCFCIDVKVSASGQDKQKRELPSHTIEQPEECFFKAGLCALRTTTDVLRLGNEGLSHITLEPASTIVRKDSTTFQLLEGFAWVEAPEKIMIEVEFGRLVGKGSFFLKRTDAGLEISTLFGSVQIFPRGGKESVWVLPGYKNTLSRVTDKGQAHIEIPQLIDLKPHLNQWKRLYLGNDRQWKGEVRTFHKVWSENVEELSVYQKKMAERQIAEARERARLRQLEKQRIAAENAKLRAMFRKRVLQIEE